MRRVALYAKCFDADGVRARLHDARLFSYLEQQELAAEARALAKRALAPLYRRPPPAWRHPVLLAAFGDALAADRDERPIPRADLHALRLQLDGVTPRNSAQFCAILCNSL